MATTISPAAATPPGNANAKDIVLRFVEEVLNGHDLGAIAELLAGDFVEQNPPPGQGPGRDGLRDFLDNLFAAFPDLTWQVQEMVVEDDRVAAWSTWSGTHRGDFLGIPPTGASVSVEAWTIDRISDGRLAESRTLMDVMSLMTQLGVVPAPESAGPTGSLE